ncbi:long-chain fatty acid--CoA ligase [Rhodococcus spelaei]|uniref:Long-chain fatty acid--CoA ligase n=1 Tax=Rhodococcus spelaei TaxID=2546320 RepID=A0A541BAP8_9NOCA|nr:AMP-binding protein [Rhodococcus spelaei]TQF69353.1 long-chain fatty acid--CoA ligase [Rhodococcus spelaei]
MSLNLALILRESVRADPDAALLHFGGRTWTRREVDAVSDRVAAGLLAGGLGSGDRVAVQLPNIPEFVFAYFGILKAGLVMVPMNPLLRPPEIAHQLARSDARVMITERGLLEQALAGASDLPDLVLVVVGDAEVVTERPVLGFEDLHVDGAEPMLEPTDAEATAVVIFTSGTTGRPKGAELTHVQLYMNCTHAGRLGGLGVDDVVVGVLPLFHVFGLSSVLDAAVRWGSALVLVPRFDADAVLDAIERHRATVLPGVPTVFVSLLAANIAGRDVSSLRLGLSGGAALSPTHLNAFEAAVPSATILEGYGLTECASVATFNTGRGARKIGSIGTPLWGTEVRLVDSAGEVLRATGPDHVGELEIRGHHVMKGYIGQPEATAAVLRAGWLATGDLGYVDGDGYYFIVDRKKDVILRGGYNVYPREVEEALLQHPSVMEAAVVGRADDRLGEEVVAFVVTEPGLRLDPDELIAFARERVAAYKYPRAVTVLDALPQGATGKVLKRVLAGAPDPVSH